ncbi:hypothetical protein Sru01_62180 [Sphaerisporangium rufum]|uniref:DUF11 domain-containing protein n=1 Tax=Sphaerisporangium rufum TaxID=1381558 RepID=A0A919V1M5_9ACTN|nr:hypothetical protein [Sphaerisporangium rufum]GII81236.1 hypothetical protein Sru01_62180 [Sphaerisporangium rufum]
MRRHLSSIAALALAGSLAGTALAAPAGAAAADTGPAATLTTATASSPQSPLDTRIRWNKTVRRGGTITYEFKSTNKGEWPTDLAGISGILPAGISKARVVGKSSATECAVDRHQVFCIYGQLAPGRSTSVKVRVWLKKSTKGTALAQFGHYSIDVPAGVDVTNEDELNRLDVQGQVDYKFFKTKIVR